MVRRSILVKAVLFASLALTDAADAGAEATAHAKSPVPSHPSRTSCAEFLKRNEITDVSDCAVTESGPFGKVGDRLYSYVLYCLIPGDSPEEAKCGDHSFTANYYATRGLGIFVQEGSSHQAQLFWESSDPDIGLYVYEKPSIVRNVFGTLMHVPVRLDGTGNGNESEYYLWSEETGEWSLLDSSNWIEDLQNRFPSGLSIATGIWPDLERMTAEVHLYREGDANCCPSGGVAFVKLALKNGSFSIQSVEFRKDEEK